MIQSQVIEEVRKGIVKLAGLTLGRGESAENWLIKTRYLLEDAVQEGKIHSYCDLRIVIYSDFRTELICKFRSTFSPEYVTLTILPTIEDIGSSFLSGYYKLAEESVLSERILMN